MRDDEYVSGHHATLTQTDDGRVWLADAGSLNGTFLNEQRVTGVAVVSSGDTIRVGRTRLRVP